jgi:hypothetical protein
LPPGGGQPSVATVPAASYIKSVTFDCSDALVTARFWAALNSDVEQDSTAERAFVEAPGWGGPNMWFIRVPEPKTAKNRMHFDLGAPGSVAAEVARLEGLGAVVAERLESHHHAGPGRSRVLPRIAPRLTGRDPCSPGPALRGAARF